jgi:predicted RNase H-like nuclease (RuvC/YqgF family)
VTNAHQELEASVQSLPEQLRMSHDMMEGLNQKIFEMSQVHLRDQENARKVEELLRTVAILEAELRDKSQALSSIVEAQSNSGAASLEG